MPVPLPHINAEVLPHGFELAFKRGRLTLGDLIDGGFAADHFIVAGHIEQALPGNAAPARHHLQKRHDVILFLWPAQPDKEDDVVIRHWHDLWLISWP